MRFVLLFMFLAGAMSLTAQKKVQLKSSMDILIEGVKYKNEKDYDKAEQLFKSVNINDTNYVLAQRELAYLYLVQDKDEQATDVLIELLNYETAFDNRASIYYTLAQSYNGVKNYNKALEILDSGIALYPMNHTLFYMKALTYELQEDFQKAVESYKDALKRNMNYHDAHLRIGILAANEAKYTQALMSLMSCILLKPDGTQSASIVALMEEIADGSFTPEKRNIRLTESGDKFDDINLLFANKVALQPKYKTKFSLPTAYAKQFHLILSNVKYNENDEGFWNQQYLEFFKYVYDAQLLDAMILFSLQSVKAPKTQKVVASKRSVIDNFVKVASDMWSQNNFDQLFDFEGKKQRIAVVYQKTGLVMGKLNNEKKTVGNWYSYHPYGNVRSVKSYNEQGEKNGVHRFYDDFTGKLIEETEYVNGKQSGTQRLYYNTGELSEVYTFKDDQMTDTVYLYYHGGQLKESIPVKEGKRHGVSLMYYENGQIQYKSTFADGKRNGESFAYHVNGNVEIEVNFENNIVNGIKKAYYPDGKTEYEYVFKNDLYEGPFKRFHANGKLEEEGQMKAGKYFGEFKSYYSNGKLFRKAQYDEGGKENGIAEYYDSEGKKYISFDFKKGSVSKVEVFDKGGNSVKTIVKSGKKLKYENYYPTRNLYCEGEIIDDKRSGVWNYYDNYGVLKQTEKYVAGELQDTVFQYFPNGAIQSKTVYNKGVKNGIYLEYNIFGILVHEGMYAGGEPVNDWYTYYDDGTLKGEYAYYDTEKHGYFNTYDVNGRLEDYEIYSKGIIVASVFLDTAGNINQRFGQYNGEISFRDPLNRYNTFTGHYNSGRVNGAGKWVDFENKVISTGTFDNGKREGVWTWFYRDGTVSKKANYKNGKLHGEYFTYHENGKISSKQIYEYGDLQGPVIYYYDNGNKESESYYEDDLKHGKMITYDYGGEIQQIRYYDKGVLLSYTYLDKNGKELPFVEIEKGETSFVVYYQNGNKAVEQKRYNGSLNGTYKEYYADGKLMTECTYFYGELVGSYIQYYPNGNKKSERNYKYGDLDGASYKYYLNGKLKELEEYQMGERNGEAKIFSEKGELLKTYIYYSNTMIDVKK